MGVPTVFVRLTGCPLRCHYCDTPYAFHNGTHYSIAAILREVQQYGTGYVTISGGEPLAQPQTFELLRQLNDSGYEVSLETSGALDISEVDPRTVIVLDIKTPGSGEQHRNKWHNLYYLKPSDQIKFVICHRQDYEWARSVIDELSLTQKHHVLLSPSFDQLNNHELADWILADHLNVRFQLQMHKYIWGDVAGH